MINTVISFIRAKHIDSFCDETTGDYRLVIKGHDIDKDQVVATLESFGDHVIEAHKV